MKSDDRIIAISKARAIETLSLQPSQLVKPGFIYVLEAWPGTYKIGKAIDFTSRVKFLKFRFPYPLSVAYAFFTHPHTTVETALHRTFKAKRLNGEWFHLDPIEDLAVIQEFANFTGFYETKGKGLVLDPFFQPRIVHHPELARPELDTNDLLECAGYLRDSFLYEDERGWHG